jgi:tetratricopeptide (TPR) repeat protein
MPAKLPALLFFLLISAVSGAQYFSKEKELVNKVKSAPDNPQLIKALGDLAEFYYIYRAEKKGDSILQRQLLIAELSNDKNLVLDALFENAISNISNWSSSETFDQALSFADKGLNYARSIGRSDLEALAYVRQAALYRKRGNYDKALQESVIALSSIAEADNDSLRIAIYLETGDIFLAKQDAVSAYKNYNNAFDLAYKNNNSALQSECYHHFANLYYSLSDLENAKSILLKSLDLNLSAKDEEGIMNDYKDLARMTDQKEYIDKLLLLATKKNSLPYLLAAKRLMIAYLMVIKQDSRAALAYLNSNEDLNESYRNTGTYNYYWNIGNIYRYSNRPDSAVFYYSLAEPGLQKSFDVSVQRSMYREMGECYLLLNSTEKSIAYFEKALAISEKQNEFTNASNISLKLSELYSKAGDYKKAFEYNKKHIVFKDTLQKMAAQRDVVLLEVERENNKHKKDMADQQARTLRIRNLQYIGISIAIAAFFMFMVLMGMFPVSKLTIKMLGFFAFICLFEFIVLLIDNYLHKITHGEPLKIWLIKIFLITALVPLQHFLEHGVVRFLASQRLLRMRQQLSVARFWSNLVARIKKPSSVEDGVEEDTAVL